MTSFKTYLAAAAALGAISAPLAAQNPYPYGYQQQYPQQQQYQYQQQYPQGYPSNGYNQGYGYNRSTGNPVTDIIDSLLGNNYSVSDRQAVRQCANAARAQASQQYGGYSRGGLRVTSITGVERRNNGLRVTGTLSAGGGYGGQYGGQYGYQNRGYNQGYGQGYAGANVSFRCNVAYNGAVTGIRIGDRRY